MNKIDRAKLADIVEEAGIKPRLKRELRFVPEEITDWSDRDFLAVMNRSKSEGVILLPLERMQVLPFQLQKRTANSKGRVESIICDICSTWQRGSHSAVISFNKKQSTVSFLCCEDLLCSLHVRDKTAASKVSRTQLREDISVDQRVERLRKKLSIIAKNITEDTLAG